MCVECLGFFVGICSGFYIYTLDMSGVGEDTLTRLRGKYGRKDLTYDAVEELADQFLEEGLET